MPIAAKEKADQDAKAAADEAAKNERARADAETKAIADEAAKREADLAHRALINTEALHALIGIIGDDAGEAVIEAIEQGKIPHVKIVY